MGRDDSKCWQVERLIRLEKIVDKVSTVEYCVRVSFVAEFSEGLSLVLAYSPKIQSKVRYLAYS